jgi:nitrate reductase / nitrite oxidoreductase, beta subunit
MPKVYNWQLGREMDYPYEGVRPKKQVGMIMDLNKCIACQTCTVICKTTWTPGRGQEHILWNNVESKPYGFYPLGWDVRILDEHGVQPLEGEKYEGKTIFESAPAGEKALGYMPSGDDYAHPNIGEDDSTGLMERGALLDLPHMNWMFYLPRICNHCTYPSCLAACSRQSIYKRQEDGIVLIDQERCRGYRECVKNCPYKKTFYNPVNGSSEKCVGCYPKIEQGLQTQCTTSCIGKIRLTGFVGTPETAREDNPMDYIVHHAKLALPLYPQFGLEPNVYYIPPIHVPPPFLHQMFGDKTAAAINTYKKAAEDEKLLGALLLFGATEYIIHRFKVEGGEAIGYDEDGDEIVRVPLSEPIQIREEWDETHQAFRTNVT